MAVPESRRSRAREPERLPREDDAQARWNGRSTPGISEAAPRAGAPPGPERGTARSRQDAPGAVPYQDVRVLEVPPERPVRRHPSAMAPNPALSRTDRVPCSLSTDTPRLS